MALAKKQGKDLRQTLSKTQEALTHLQEVMLPGEDAPNTLERLANVFSASDAAIKDYSYMQTERGARSLISLTLAHGTKVDFEAITSSFPVGPDGKAVSMKKYTKLAKPLASQFSKLIATREAEKKAKAVASESELH